MHETSGKTVLITGASRGIGAETAREFANAGANVVLLARNSEEISTLAASIGSAALAVRCDVGRFEDLSAAVHFAKQRFGKIDVLINNAGLITPIALLSQSDPAAWKHVIDVNLTGVYNGMRAVMPDMLDQGGGTILTVSSGAAHNALEGWSHYCASKAGAAMLTSCVHLEGSGHGIRAMGLSPGTVATDMQVEIKDSGVNPVSLLDPSVHIPPSWPAKALLWMCTRDADGYLGQEISLREPEIRERIGVSAQ